ncbi:MAG: HEAT repeat domain-containing protein [Candidatus Aminicenantes bacterium]|nr:HEAT repeat domain-containing protein [Candidatus Aminicenantes bacterium]
MNLIPSLEAVTYLRKLKARNIGIIGFEGFRVHKDGGFTPLLERIADFSGLLEDAVTWQEFLERSHKESVRRLAEEDMHNAPDIAYWFSEFNEEDWETSRARDSMSEESSGTYWGRPIEYSAEFIEQYIERLREARGPIEECSPLEDLDAQTLPILLEYAMSEQDEDVRAYLVEVIWEYRRPEFIPFLAKMLNDPSKKVWKTALDGLVCIGTDETLTALKTARASAPVDQLEYIDEAINQLEHPEAWPGIK